MNELIPIYVSDEGVPVTTSRAVAEQFGKRHDHVLRDIENLIAELKQTEDGKAFTAPNFGVSEYTDISGKTNKQYLMTRDGFTLLAMGFTGARALQFKLAYINAFNRMERILQGYGDQAPKIDTFEYEIKAISAAAGNIVSDEEARIYSQTLHALENAVNRGEVFLYRKYQRGALPCGAVGAFSRNSVTVRLTALWKLYAAQEKGPLPYRVWKSYIKETAKISKLPGGRLNGVCGLCATFSRGSLNFPDIPDKEE